MNLFAELKRRNVYKVAAAYAVVSWLLIQAASILFPTFDAPAWVMKVFVVAIILGFPIALIIAWAFELTPQGIKRAESSDAEGGKSSRSHAWIYVVVTVAVLALGLSFVARFTMTKKESTSASLKSIAVLPFESLSEDKNNAYFASGMQDEILTRLTKIGALKVISRTSTQKYQSAPANLREIGQQLGVANILEGSVQKAGEQVHINVQLIRAATDEHVWAESYDRELKNIFGVEREIAETVAGELKANLLPQEKTELARVPTTNPEAYDLYLRAKYIDQQYWNSDIDSVKPALDLYRKAIALDPNFALAYAWLARSQFRMYWTNEDHSPERLAQAEADAAKSLQLQPDLPEGRYAEAAILGIKGENAKALAQFEVLQKRVPNDAQFAAGLALAKARAGDQKGSSAGYLRATELDPHNSNYLRYLAGTYDALGRYSEAQPLYEKARALAPDDWNGRVNGVNNLIYQGRLSEAQQAISGWPDAKLSATARSYKYGTIEYIAVLSREYDSALAANQKVPALGNRLPGAFTLGDILKNTNAGFDHLYKKDIPGARASFLAAREGLERLRSSHLNDPDFYNSAALIAAGLGERDAAIDAARKACDLAPLEKDAIAGSNYLFTLAQVYAHFGDAEKAIPILGKLIHLQMIPIAPAILQRDPIWDPIRKDLRFQKLCEEKQP